MKHAASFILCAFLLFFFWYPKPSHAANFIISPGEKRVGIGELFDVEVILDTEGTRVSAADAKLGFDASTLTVAQIHDGDLFSTNSSHADDGKITLAGASSQVLVAKRGKLATITFSARSQGVTGLTFFCTPGKKTDLTNIENEDNEDIVDCSRLPGGIYTVAPPGTAEQTGTPSATGAVSIVIASGTSPTPMLSPVYATPKKTSRLPSVNILPQSTVENNPAREPLILFITGVFLVIAGIMIVLL